MGWFQGVLDLFGGAPVEAPVRPLPPRKPPKAKKIPSTGPRGAPLWQLPVLSDVDLLASKPNARPESNEVERPTATGTPLVAMSPPTTLPSPNVLQHTAATHRIVLETRNTGSIEVAYRLDRAKRRSIGFLVSEEGLSVKAPRWVGLPEIQQAIRDKSPWILRKLSEVQVRAEQSLTQRIDWASGGTFDLLGEPVTLVLDPSHNARSGQSQLQLPDADHPHTRLVLHVPHGASSTQIRDAAKAWLLRQAKQHFTERLNHFAPQLGVHWTRLTLSNAGTRWGSAKIDGSIRLHWRLIHFKPSIIDYVVVHELSHLRVMDHSPRFWETVAILVPDYAQQRKHLRTQHLPKWD